MTTEAQKHTEECREAFEKLLPDASTYDFSRDRDGDYVKGDTWEAYQGFEAAWNARAESGLTIADYEEVLADHRRLVRELDVAMHGEEGAANKASLCDLIAPARRMSRLGQELVEALEYYANPTNWHSPNSSSRGYHVTNQNGSMERYHAKVGGFLHGCFVPDAGDMARAALGKANPTGQVVKAPVRESGDRNKQGGFVIGDVVEYIGQYRNDDGWKGNTFIICEIRQKNWGIEYAIREWDRWDGLVDGLFEADLRLATTQIEGQEPKAGAQ